MCDAHRIHNGRTPVTELDAAETWRSGLHVAGENASLLTAACSLADLADLDEQRFDVVGVTGNSMGWYTALAASGALPMPQAIELIDTMGAYQQRNIIGGQVLYPITDADWRTDKDNQVAVDAAIAGAIDAGGQAHWSIRLGGYAVLGADRAGLKYLLNTLPEQKRGSRTFPVQLPMHSAFHTPLMRDTSTRARGELAHLALRAPKVPLIDGRGMVFRPGSADPTDLYDYTVGTQVVDPYDFTTAVRAGLRFTGAEVVIALGPGNSLGGPLARILVQEGWRGARSRPQLDVLQKGERPALLSFGVSMQRKTLV
jgi:malonyl CoA-acyl carrier protein transacylase